MNSTDFSPAQCLSDSGSPAPNYELGTSNVLFELTSSAFVRRENRVILLSWKESRDAGYPFPV